MAALTAIQAFTNAMLVNDTNYITEVDRIVDELYAQVNTHSLSGFSYSIMIPITQDPTHSYDYHINLYSMVEKKFIEKGYRCILNNLSSNKFIIYISWRNDAFRGSDLGDYPYN